MTAPRRSVPVAARVRYQAVRGLRTLRRWRGFRPPGPGEPPNVPAGWVTGPPHFVGIGVQKAGTSWWEALIHQHPGVHRAGGRPKELHFFDACWERPFTDADAERYARYFPRPRDGGITGEWTPSYVVDFWGPALIRRAAPQARILVLLRDPVERYRSSMAHTDDMSRGPLGRLDAMGAFQRGLYAQQLRRVFQAFEREQVLILQYERCLADPQAELARTFDFLGLRPHAVDRAAFEQPVNPTTGRRYELTPALRASITAAYAPDLAELPPLAPDIDLDLWPTARQGRGG